MIPYFLSIGPAETLQNAIDIYDGYSTDIRVLIKIRIKSLQLTSKSVFIGQALSMQRRPHHSLAADEQRLGAHY